MATVIGLGIIGFLLRTVVASWEEIRSRDWHFNGALLILSLLLLIVNVLQQSAILRVVLRKLGNGLPYRQVFCMLSISSLGSYLPGRFWSYASLAYLGRRHSIPVLSSGVGIVTVMATSSVAAAILSLLVGYRYIEGKIAIVALLAVPLLLVMVHPAVVNWILAHIPARWRVSGSPVPLSFGEILSLVVWQIFSWVLQGLHLSTLALSVWPLSTAEFILVMGVAPAAWLVGYYTFVTPGGLGVKEGVTAFLLTACMPFPFAAGVALISQAALILVQIVCALAALRIR